jgi:hypothetical protein
MARIWVLDTETKGTGAEMVPLEKVQGGSGSSRGPVVVSDKPQREAATPEPRKPPRFKVVDVMTEKVLAEGASTTETIAVLEKTRSLVDVRIYVWDAASDSWRRLSLGEHKALWGLRGRS